MNEKIVFGNDFITIISEDTTAKIETALKRVIEENRTLSEENERLTKKNEELADKIVDLFRKNEELKAYNKTTNDNFYFYRYLGTNWSSTA